MAWRVSMRKIKEVLRLSYQGGLSARQVARSLNISRSADERISGAGQQSWVSLAFTRHFKRTGTGATFFPHCSRSKRQPKRCRT